MPQGIAGALFRDKQMQQNGIWAKAASLSTRMGGTTKRNGSVLEEMVGGRSRVRLEWKWIWWREDDADPGTQWDSIFGVFKLHATCTQSYPDAVRNKQWLLKKKIQINFITATWQCTRVPQIRWAKFLLIFLFLSTQYNVSWSQSPLTANSYF